MLCWCRLARTMCSVVRNRDTFHFQRWISLRRKVFMHFQNFLENSTLLRMRSISSCERADSTVAHPVQTTLLQRFCGVLTAVTRYEWSTIRLARPVILSTWHVEFCF